MRANRTDQFVPLFGDDDLRLALLRVVRSLVTDHVPIDELNHARVVADGRGFTQAEKPRQEPTFFLPRGLGWGILDNEYHPSPITLS
jgi:hypothetical protein